VQKVQENFVFIERIWIFEAPNHKFNEMKTNFLCPHCRGHLRVSNSIIFLTKTTKGKSGLLLVNPELGDYSVKMHPEYNDFEEGEVVNFICPICYENLDAKEYNKNLAKIIMQDENGKESTIVFSKITGEKCTYQIHEGVVKSYGEGTSEYGSIFGDII
jgi:rubredoxin